MKDHRFPVMEATLQAVAAGRSLEQFDSVLFLIQQDGGYVEIISLLPSTTLAGRYQVIVRDLNADTDERWRICCLTPDTIVTGVICEPMTPIAWDWWALDAIERITTDRILPDNE